MTAPVIDNEFIVQLCNADTTPANEHNFHAYEVIDRDKQRRIYVNVYTSKTKYAHECELVKHEWFLLPHSDFRAKWDKDRILRIILKHIRHTLVNPRAYYF